MTRTEINEIKARMLDDLLKALFDDSIDGETLRQMESNIKFASNLLDKTLTDQAELLKKNGYMGA